MIFRYRNFIYDGADLTIEYAYDSNGNVTRDDNRGLTDITYNAINLPSHIEVGSDAIMDYIYDATGNKLGIRSRICYVTNRESAPDIIEFPYRAEDRDYIGNYEFKNGELLRLNTPYGYCTLGSYIPYKRDYQGNNRNNADYYAYGLPVQDSNVSDQDPYLYGGKEFYSLRGINLYDFSARIYAPDIARFMQPDPKAGDYHWLSPYAYCAGDPINNIDPDGKIFWNIIAGVVGATIDAVTQVSTKLISGESFVDALLGVDVTSIIASGVTCALLGPGAGMSTKIAATTINAADSAVDVKLNGNIRYVGGEGNNEKPIAEVAIDLGVSMMSDFGIKHQSMDLSTPEIRSTSDEITSFLEIGSNNWTKKEMDRATKIILKVNGEGLKFGVSDDNPLKQKRNTAPTDAITPKPLPPVQKIYLK